MTLDEARQLRCPHKPSVTDLDTQTLQPTCEPKGCMCWVKTSNSTYIDQKWVHIDRVSTIDESKYDFIKSNYPYRLYGIPHPLEQGYCTLRGDINDSN